MQRLALALGMIVCIGGADRQPAVAEIELPDVRVRLVADDDGSLAHLYLGQGDDRRDLARGKAAYKKLNREILQIIGRPGNPLTKDLTVVIKPDRNLKYRAVVRAMSACAGRKEPKSGRFIRYVRRIRVAIPGKNEEDETPAATRPQSSEP